MEPPKESFHIKCSQSSVLNTILDSVRQISVALQYSPVVVLQTFNKFGDQQLHQDVHCDQIVQKHLKNNPQVKGFASEQRPEYHQISQGNGYVVTYDPLDGSSIIDTNFSVGSIFSIWPANQNKLIGDKLSYQTNAVLAVYGPRTTVIFYNPEVQKVQQLTLIKDKWILSHDNLVIKEKTKMFSPGNLRAVTQNKEYFATVQRWIEKAFTLRYTGGLVPDIAQIFIKGHGIFCNVHSKSHKSKLRVLYQVAAVGYLIQKANGKTITIGKKSLHQIQVKTYDDRISFGAGSAQQVAELTHLF